MSSTNQQVLYNELAQLNTTLDSFNLGTGIAGYLQTIATNSTTTATDSTTLAGTVATSLSGDSIRSDLKFIGGYDAANNTGNTDNGVLRVCIATDDINTSSMKNNLTTLAACTSSNLVNNNINQIGANDISVGSGVNGTGVQRVTIATDDQTATNIQNINYSIKTTDDVIYTNGNYGITNLAVAGDGTTARTGDSNKFVPLASDLYGVQYTNTKRINDNIISSGSGVNGTGVQRVTLATDDQLMSGTGGLVGPTGGTYVNLADVYGACSGIVPDLDAVLGNSFTVNSSTNKFHNRVIGSVRNDTASTTLTITNQAWCPVSVDSTGVVFENLQKIAGTTTAVNSGVNSNGVIRVTIATDDSVNTKLTTISTTLTNIYTILNAVYSAGAATGQLRTNVIP